MRLKFEMWKDRDDNVFSRFTDGRGIYTDSWWSSPPSSIDHVGMGYLPQRHRHPNVRNERHMDFIKRRFKEEVVKFLPQAIESKADTEPLPFEQTKAELEEETV